MVLSARPDAPPADPPGDEMAGSGPGRRSSWWLVLGSLAALCVPLVAVLVRARREHWTPVLDLAMTELRVRDVGGRHSPLIGLPGRIGSLTEQGSHPGPISFYALAPTYRLLGSTAWALQVATVMVHAVAIGTALVISSRRGGPRLVVVMAALLAVLAAGYGGGALTEPWNPYLPLLWWMVALLAVWSVLCGDLPMLPVAVVAGSFCAQTHVPYLALALGAGALAVVGVVLHQRAHPSDRRRTIGWVLGAVGVGLVIWLPPTVDQLRHDPGNYELLVDHFSDPPEEVQGVRYGVEAAARHLDVVDLAADAVVDPGRLVRDTGSGRSSGGRGAVVLAVWAVSAAVALRRGSPHLVRLHLVVALAVGLMVLSISRIFGVPWYYLTLWGWGIAALAVLAVGWTVAEVVSARWPAERRASAARTAIAMVAVLGLLVVARFTVEGGSFQHADAPVARQLAAVVDDTVAGLDAGAGASTGRDGRYLLTWDDALHIGSQGFGLLNELERHGFDVGVQPSKRTPATPHRVLAADQATARVHLATGGFVDRWRDVAGAVEIATFDPRDRAQRAEHERLRTEVASTLRDLGLDELVPLLDDNLFGAAIDPRVPEVTQRQMGRMLELGAPLAVFVVAVDAVAA